jgi:hypothetical protein
VHLSRRSLLTSLCAYTRSERELLQSRLMYSTRPLNEVHASSLAQTPARSRRITRSILGAERLYTAHPTLTREASKTRFGAAVVAVWVCQPWTRLLQSKLPYRYSRGRVQWNRQSLIWKCQVVHSLAFATSCERGLRAIREDTVHGHAQLAFEIRQ